VKTSIRQFVKQYTLEKDEKHWRDLTIMKLFKAGALTLFSTLFVVLLAACGTLSGSTNSPTTSVPAPVATTAATSAAPQFTIVTLKHNPTGTTNLSWDPESKNLTVAISLTGLAPNSSHAAHIHAGTCAVDGSIVYPLNPVVADAKGNAATTTIIKNVQDGIPASGWYVNVHNGLQMTPLEHMPISCGNIVNSNTSQDDTQSVQVQMQGSTAPNESATGNAALTVLNGKLALKITLSGLQPNSSHAAHIHAGSCESQGAPIVMLNPVVANAQGIGTSITTIDHLPSSSNGLYINVHAGATMGDLQQATLFNPIACGDLLQ
jgi:Cu/Zn superoxide dismutase